MHEILNNFCWHELVTLVKIPKYNVLCLFMGMRDPNHALITGPKTMHVLDPCQPLTNQIVVFIISRETLANQYLK